jgi:hypothetical protein
MEPVYEYLVSKHPYPGLWEHFPRQLHGKHFPTQVRGKNFPTQVPVKDFPTDVLRNCILSIILAPASVSRGWNNVRLFSSITVPSKVCAPQVSSVSISFHCKSLRRPGWCQVVQYRCTETGLQYNPSYQVIV